MAERIAVRPEDLERYAAQIDQVRREVESGIDDVDGRRAGVESRLVLEALEDFAAAWSDRRRSLLDEMREASDGLRDGATAFETEDQGLANQIAAAPPSGVSG